MVIWRWKQKKESADSSDKGELYSPSDDLTEIGQHPRSFIELQGIVMGLLLNADWHYSKCAYTSLFKKNGKANK